MTDFRVCRRVAFQGQISRWESHNPFAPFMVLLNHALPRLQQYQELSGLTFCSHFKGLVKLAFCLKANHVSWNEVGTVIFFPFYGWASRVREVKWTHIRLQASKRSVKVWYQGAQEALNIDRLAAIRQMAPKVICYCWFSLYYFVW